MLQEFAPKRSGALSSLGAATRDRVKSVFREHGRNRLEAKYDAAQTTLENERLWSMADNLSADSAADPGVRKKVRERSRYEAGNNSYYHGALETNANAQIGRGPTKRFYLGERRDNRDAARAFRRWARRANLAAKLRLMTKAYYRDGEVIATRFTNYQMRGDVLVDFEVVECDRLCAPYDAVDDPRNIDGVLVDENGVPTGYQILDRHPGEVNAWVQGDFGAFTRYDATDCVHWAHTTRPGQHRGMPAVTPCLPLFAQFRRFKLAVLTAAETAANVAAMLKLDVGVLQDLMASEALGDGGLLVDPEELFDLPRGSIPALPPGYDFHQMEAEQPATTLEMFERVLLREISRCFGQTFSVFAGDSSDANMASGNLDERRWWQHNDVVREDLDVEVLDPITDWWWQEQRFIDRSIRSAARRPLAVDHATVWPTRFEHNDPQKVAAATEKYHALGLVTDEHLLAQWGRDFDEHDEQLAEQVQRRSAIGLAPVGPTVQQPDTLEADEDDDRP